jgi:hypothetical protein
MIIPQVTGIIVIDLGVFVVSVHSRSRFLGASRRGLVQEEVVCCDLRHVGNLVEETFHQALDPIAFGLLKALEKTRIRPGF